MAIRNDRKSNKFQMALYYLIMLAAAVVSVVSLVLHGVGVFIITTVVAVSVTIAAGYVLGVSRYNK